MMKLFLIGGLALLAVLFWRKWRRGSQAIYINAYPYQRWLDQRLAARRPELTAEQRTEVFSCLVDYFRLCQMAGRRMVAMPSQAVDDAWHELILFTRQYDKFCHRAFGRFLHHTPAEAMISPTQAGDGIKRAWRLACRHEGIDPKKPARLPRLFALDSRLGIAGGFVYQRDCLATNRSAGSDGYCASHIGCSSGGGGCAGDSGGSDSAGDGGGGCGGGD